MAIPDDYGGEIQGKARLEPHNLMACDRDFRSAVPIPLSEWHNRPFHIYGQAFFFVVLFLFGSLSGNRPRLSILIQRS